MHPTKKQWQTVIDNFEKVLPMAESKTPNHLDMMEASVNVGHECGTVHCVGGWYAVATLDTRKELNYANGARKMASDLGFDDHHDLKFWAAGNPDIWGNHYGMEMFTDSRAYNNAETLREVVEFLKGVRDRLRNKNFYFMKKQQDPIKELRALINDGFKEYDGDIREEALEALDLVEKIYKTATSNFDTQANDVDELTKENATLKNKCEALEKVNKKLSEFRDDYMREEIDFGTAKIYYAIEPGGVCIINELMQALKDAAQIVPLSELVATIKRSPSFPR